MADGDRLIVDANGFATLVQAVSQSGTRRRLVHLVAALPVASLVAGLLAAEHADGQGNGAGVGGGGGRRRRRTRHHPGQDKGKRKKPCAKAGQIPNKGTRKGCCQGLSMDASGRCAAPAPVPCTGLSPTATSPTQGLQEAINQADAGATLTLCAGTWNLTETVSITKDLTLIGAGAGATALDGGATVRVLSIATGATVTLQDLTITKGKVTSLYISQIGGGITNQGTLTLLGVHVSGNTSERGGGGIGNFGGTLTLQTGSRVTGNTVGSPFGNGGGILIFTGSLTLEEGSSVSGNTANTTGGGIQSSFASITLLAGSRVTGNTAPDGGAGVGQNGPVRIDAGAIICSNTPLNDQCPSVFTGTGPCPAPSETCP